MDMGSTNSTITNSSSNSSSKRAKIATTTSSTSSSSSAPLQLAGLTCDFFRFLHVDLNQFVLPLDRVPTLAQELPLLAAKLPGADDNNRRESVSVIALGQDGKPLRGIWIPVPIQQGELWKALKANGWKIHRFDDEAEQFVMLYELTEKRTVPDPGSASMGVSAVLMDEQAHVLWVENTSRPGKKGFPGGIADKGEGPITTAIREVKEELGYTIPANSHFIMVAVNFNEQFRYGQMDMYVVLQILLPKGQLLPTREELKLQSSEIVASDNMSWTEMLATNSGMREDYEAVSPKILANIAHYYHAAVPTTTAAASATPAIAIDANATVPAGVTAVDKSGAGNDNKDVNMNGVSASATPYGLALVPPLAKKPKLRKFLL